MVFHSFSNTAHSYHHSIMVGTDNSVLTRKRKETAKHILWFFLAVFTLPFYREKKKNQTSPPLEACAAPKSAVNALLNARFCSVTADFEYNKPVFRDTMHEYCGLQRSFK